MTLNAIILAAGQGTRMRSSLPKVLHPILGRPMISYAVEAVAGLSDDLPVVVVGHGAEAVCRAVGQSARFVTQERQLGTAHAVKSAAPALRGKCDLVLVTSADMPLLTPETLAHLVQAQEGGPGPLAILTVVDEDSHGFGRVIRDGQGKVREIVEEAHATPEQRAIHELNAGVYCFAADWLWEALEQVPVSPKGEYYLTDVIGLAVKQGLPVKALTADDPCEAIGVNTRVHLAEAGRIMRQRINTAWMLAGVTLIDPQTTYIEPGVVLGQDTVIWPNSYLHGKTEVGAECEIGPNTILRDTKTGSRCKILASVLEGALLEDGVSMGPFCHLRKGAHLANGVHMGNFGEVKDSYLGPGTKMGHFSYIGNATIGADVNIGAGTITCNYDGKHKHPTEIGDGVFVGSDTMLVAPVKLGEGSKTGAGSVVTHDVPDHTLVVGVPARPLRKLESGE
ncbi:MAG TPA: bifunctional UDP-N-acetylglucosamine diphosphorylase/glucosamine-1-phosphate N-acetyltransferase GlmU [Anaerolineaceae bacterium]|nr:bifunctional UDP-N-acetylglucosamine diphosphorylase/glucosamine-1-phosphate N-acetyltransferase GlmU [Anaerolineaceae bacterium]